MLVHHDNRSYQEASSIAAAHAREKLEALIARGRGRVGNVLDQIQSQIPVDKIAPASRIAIINSQSGLQLGITNGHEEVGGIHDHALAQMAERAEMPWKYVQRLRELGMRDLVATNLNRLFDRTPDRRFLVRSVAGQVRGFLSDSFRRLDSRPIVDEFCKVVAAIGALPYEGHALETKIAIKAILPRVFEPVTNEVMAFGAVLQNSDFGDGALSLRTWMLRLWCTNEAIMEECLRQIHLGGKLPEDVTFSERTYRLDTARSASMVRDVVTNVLAPAKIEETCNLIRKANDEAVSPHAIKSFLDKHLLKTEAKAAVEAFNSPDVVNLPPGQTVWRLSNAVSWIARNEEDEHRKLELQQVAALALRN